MYTYAEAKVSTVPGSLAALVRELRPIETKIHAEGKRDFDLYLPDPVNYWEVYARLLEIRRKQ
jgi:hypothetical protein